MLVRNRPSPVVFLAGITNGNTAGRCVNGDRELVGHLEKYRRENKTQELTELFGTRMPLDISFSNVLLVFGANHTAIRPYCGDQPVGKRKALWTWIIWMLPDDEERTV